MGSNLVRVLLRENFEITVIDSLIFGGESLLDVWPHPNFTFVKGDITKKDVIEQLLSKHEFDAVVHLAAIVGDPACSREPDLARKTNWEASCSLLNASIKNNVKRFIFASTCSNYGKMSDQDGYLDENSTLAPVSLYAELKVKFEKLMLEEMEKTPAFCPTSLRFATVYGISPRMRFDLTVNEFTKELACGKELLVYGEHRRR